MNKPMTRPYLEGLPIHTLRTMARRREIDTEKQSRGDLIQALLEFAALERAQ